MNEDLEWLKQACAIVETDALVRGTAYLIRPDRAATSFHVIKEVPEGATVLLQFPTGPFRARVEQRDEIADCAILKLDAPLQNVEPLCQATRCIVDDRWTAYGFPATAGSTGVAIKGEVRDPHAVDTRNAPALQLYSNDAAAGSGPPLQGFSGAPVTIQRRVVGHLNWIIPDQQGNAQLGLVYACPIAFVEARLPHSSGPENQPPWQGPMAYINCNRDKPTLLFKSEIIRYFSTFLDMKPGSEHPPCSGPLQLYVVQGRPIDCPGSFIDRLKKFALPELTQERPPGLWDDLPRIKDISATWKCGLDGPDMGLKLLMEDIISGMAKDKKPPTAGNSTKWDFQSRFERLTQNIDVIFIRHSVDIVEWDSGMEQMLQQYITLFCEMVDKTPLILFFFTLKAGPKISLFSLLKRMTANDVLTTFATVAKRNPPLHYCELKVNDSVVPSDVEKLLRKMYPEISDSEILKKLQPIFPKWFFVQRKRVPMLKIEEHFDGKKGHAKRWKAR